MDILYLVDRLEELFNESQSVFLTKNVLVNEERMLDLIDQMRLSIPEEIKKAQRIITQKDIIIAQANEEANRTIELQKLEIEMTRILSQVKNGIHALQENITSSQSDREQLQPMNLDKGQS
jgi:hypothetical protein